MSFHSVIEDLQLIDPWEVYEIEIDRGHTCNAFLPSHPKSTGDHQQLLSLVGSERSEFKQGRSGDSWIAKSDGDGYSTCLLRISADSRVCYRQSNPVQTGTGPDRYVRKAIPVEVQGTQLKAAT